MSVDPSQLMQTLGAGMQGAQPQGQPQGDPSQAIIWQTFPSTDPAQVAQVWTGQDPQSAAHAYVDMVHQDVAQLQQLQDQAMQSHVGATASGAPQSQTPPSRGPGPGAGGGLGG